MRNSTINCFEIVNKFYKPNNNYLIEDKNEKIKPIKYIRGEHMLSTEFKRKLIKDLGSDAYVIYDYFYEMSKQNNSKFSPTDDKAIADKFGWSASKVTRLKSLLKKAGYLLIIKETTNKKTTLYKILMTPSIIDYYKTTGTVPEDVNIVYTTADIKDKVLEDLITIKDDNTIESTVGGANE